MLICQRKTGTRSEFDELYKLGTNIVNNREDGFNTEIVLYKFCLENGRLKQEDDAYYTMWVHDYIITDWNLLQSVRTLLESQNIEDTLELYLTYLEIRHPQYTYH